MLPRKQPDGTYSARAWLACSIVSVPFMFATLFFIGHVLLEASVRDVGIATAVYAVIQLAFVPTYKISDDALRKPPHRPWPLAICVAANVVLLTAGFFGWVALHGVIPWTVAAWLVLAGIVVCAATLPLAVNFSRTLNKT